MSKKKTKLKKIELTSVDMVRRGANQEAYINLYKSAGDPAEPNAPSVTTTGTPPDAPGAAQTDEIPQGLLKSIVEAVKGFFKAEGSPEDEPDELESPEGVEKAAETFADKRVQQEIRDDRWRYQDALNMSIDSILQDGTITAERKSEMMAESILQFSNAYMEMCEKLLKPTANRVTEPTATLNAVGKSQENSPEIEEKGGNEEMKIDKSRFTAEELATYDALIAKGKVEDDEPEKNVETPEKEVEKSAEMHPEVRKALDEMAELKKSMEMQQMTDIAKKYVSLGKKEDELAQTLYDMKKSSPASYDAYIAVLDQNLDLVNKSGLFTEIGKSGAAGGFTSVAKSEPEAKIDAIAKGYLEKDPNMDYDTAVLKAWENNPDLLDAYDSTY